MVRVRFAPSPTGKIHVGNGRTALANALFALSQQGTFVVRMEDTDVDREVAGSEEKILDDLDWLGITPNESPRIGGDFGPYRTNDRDARGDYTKVIEKLMAEGKAYECFVSKTELDLMRKIQTSQSQPPHYDNRHRNLSEAEKEAFRAEGRKPVIRFVLEDGPIEFNDLVCGKMKFEAKNLGGDPVIVRSNGVPIFALGGAVDDISQEITHVIRGEDHLTNTAIQVRIFEALGAKVPVFAHMPMLLDTDGGKLSKRIDSLSIEQLRSQGYMPNAIITYMASLGTGIVPEIGPAAEIAKTFDFSKMGRSAVRFDMEQLNRINAQELHQTSFADIKPHIGDFLDTESHPNRIEMFWDVAKHNITTLADIGEYYNICFGETPKVNLEEADAAYIQTAESTLPAGPYNEDTWNSWVGELKTQTGRKGKALFMPLRLALTGQSHGPEMASLLTILGEETARERLKANS